jgi:hypothetical protein
MMFRKLLLAMGIVVLGASAGETYRVTFFQPSVVKGQEFKAGDYRIRVADQKVMIVDGKREVEVAAKVEAADQKFAATTVRYSDTAGKFTIAEIRLGGTKTKLVFNP